MPEIPHEELEPELVQKIEQVINTDQRLREFREFVQQLRRQALQPPPFDLFD